MVLGFVAKKKERDNDKDDELSDVDERGDNEKTVEVGDNERTVEGGDVEGRGSGYTGPMQCGRGGKKKKKKKKCETTVTPRNGLL